MTNLKCQLKERGLNKIYEGIEEPKEANRRMSNLFSQWLKQKFPNQFRDKEGLLKESKPGIYFLKGSDSELLDFAQRVLGYSGDKRPDLIGKIVAKNDNQIYIVGEAKFLTDYGGHQNDQLNDALDLLKVNFDVSKLQKEIITAAEINPSPIVDIVPVAVLDGVVWIKGMGRDPKMLRKVLELPDNKIALSALLLEDFFNCLLNTGDVSSCI